jgi:hypothetical protein
LQAQAARKRQCLATCRRACTFSQGIAMSAPLCVTCIDGSKCLLDAQSVARSSILRDVAAVGDGDGTTFPATSLNCSRSTLRAWLSRKFSGRSVDDVLKLVQVCLPRECCSWRIDRGHAWHVSNALQLPVPRVLQGMPLGQVWAPEPGPSQCTPPRRPTGRQNLPCWHLKASITLLPGHSAVLCWHEYHSAPLRGTQQCWHAAFANIRYNHVNQCLCAACSWPS